MALTTKLRPPRAGGAPRAAVILLHGYGDSGGGLMGLADPLSVHLPHAMFISPDAPHACEIAPGAFQWFGLQDWSPHSLYAGADRAAIVLDKFIDAQLAAHNLQPEQVALAGFSQGCMMALHVGLRRTRPVAAILGYSGALVGPERVPAEMKSKPPVMLVHGMMDTVVPYAALPTSVQYLRSAGVPVVSETRPALGHSIDEIGLESGGRFLAEHLAA